MAPKTVEERLHEIHYEALVEFDRIQEALRDEREQCLKDRRFYSIAGAQWEGPLGEQFKNKPRFEVNKIHLSVIRIINEYRNNRITVDFRSRDGANSDKLADTCDGLYRADENDSCAEEAYDNAFEEAVGGGFGAWRLRTEYEDEEDEENDQQRIIFEPIFDADSSVYFDLQAKRQDKKDAVRCWVLSSVTPQAFEEEWGFAPPSSWPKEVYDHEFDWATPDVVYVAEYYQVEAVRETLYIWEMLDGSEKRLRTEEHKEQQDELEAIGGELVRTKRVRKKRVHKYIMSGDRILEDCGFIAGRCIPIIPVYGKRWFVDNVERCMGHVRLATDAQRLKNTQLSKLGEISALSSVSKPIVLPEQITGHQLMWEDDNIKNYPYLLLNPIKDVNGNTTPAPPLAYTQPADIPPALAALLQLTEEDINDLLGNTQQGEQMQGNISTETAHLISNRLDMQTFIYLSNFAKAMRRCGEVWLSMARDVYVEDSRTMETLAEDNTPGSVVLNQPVRAENDAIIYENDLAHAKMKVITSVGPSSSTKRMATVRALMGMMEKTDDPVTKQVLSAMTMMNMEGEGVEDVRGFFRMQLIRMGVVTPTEEEQEKLAQEQANQQPTSQDQYFEAAAAKEQAEAVEKQANTLLKQAQADKTRAETAETIVGIKQGQAELALDAVEKLGPRVTPPDIPGSPVENP